VPLKIDSIGHFRIDLERGAQRYFTDAKPSTPYKWRPSVPAKVIWDIYELEPDAIQPATRIIAGGYAQPISSPERAAPA
jgi:hypothetical protein